MNTRWMLAFAIAVFSDLLDYFAFGWVIGYGDLIDFITGAALFMVTKNYLVLGGLVEIVPGADFFPIWTVVTAGAYTMRKKELE